MISEGISLSLCLSPYLSIPFLIYTEGHTASASRQHPHSSSRNNKNSEQQPHRHTPHSMHSRGSRHASQHASQEGVRGLPNPLVHVELERDDVWKVRKRVLLFV